MNLKLINTRRNNEIFLDDEHCYKIFKEGYSKNDVFLEAFITAKVESLGIKVSPIDEVKLIDGRWAYQSPELIGKSLYDLMSENPDKMDEYLDLFVKVQTDIHTYKCPGIPIQKDKLTDYINSSNLDDSLKIDLIDMLNSSPKHKKLCHGNFTPHNIIISDDGEIFITDWNHATQGNASADAARTYLWMLQNMKDYAEKYLSDFCEKTSTSSQYVHRWIPIVAAARIAKNNPDEIELLRSQISIIEY